MELQRQQSRTFWTPIVRDTGICIVHAKRFSRGNTLPVQELLRLHYTDSQFWRNRQRNAGVGQHLTASSNTQPIATNGFMIHAYRVLGPNKVHEHVALHQYSPWPPPRPTPGILNSRERP